ncbi:hypothetical protein SAY86_028466 [Trapa natans]|uniref:Rad21/Rec8-like protein N-terminal domain-containing protein n=1 Tax=Trapa natans TaxID=22666 RepID=A0AAN7LZS3_TRANT|nr:hypothetical protein SAY86_028466 [Trapa natans]
MSYSQFILAKKGPLGTIWIAAHLERKLRKNQVADTDIGVSVDSIIFPEVPIALRLSSHLLLGVVRIYSRQVNYLFDDCSEALLKRHFYLEDFELLDNENFLGNYADHHVSAKEQITLQDTREGVVYSTSQFGPDERFGDGDTGQIHLDLEEVEIPNTKPEPCEYAEAPVTPMLVEEANLSIVQEASVSGDHMKLEAHNIHDEMEVKNANTDEFSELAQGFLDRGAKNDVLPSCSCPEPEKPVLSSPECPNGVVEVLGSAGEIPNAVNSIEGTRT